MGAKVLRSDKNCGFCGGYCKSLPGILASVVTLYENNSFSLFSLSTVNSLIFNQFSLSYPFLESIDLNKSKSAFGITISCLEGM